MENHRALYGFVSSLSIILVGIGYGESFDQSQVGELDEKESLRVRVIGHK